MRIRIVILISFALMALLLLIRKPVSLNAQQSEAGQQNPVKSTPESEGRARKLYGYDCAVCHGVKGDGKGDMSADFPGKIRDFTDPAALKDFTDEQLFTIIKDGKGDMPPEGKRAKTNELWGLVNYVRSFSKKE